MAINTMTDTTPNLLARAGNFVRDNKRKIFAGFAGPLALFGSGCSLLDDGLMDRTPKEGEICIIRHPSSSQGMIDDADTYFDGDSLIRGAGNKMVRVANADEQEQRSAGKEHPVGRFAICMIEGDKDSKRIVPPSTVEADDSLGELITPSDARFGNFLTEED